MILRYCTCNVFIELEKDNAVIRKGNLCLTTRGLACSTNLETTVTDPSFTEFPRFCTKRGGGQGLNRPQAKPSLTPQATTSSPLSISSLSINL